MTSTITNGAPGGRNASLDAARGILMMLGVVLHTANIYSTGGGWLVWDAERSSFFDWLTELVHVFRMPAFFWISGYFCALTFQRNGAAGLVQKRLPRLALPLISAWVVLNITQEILLALWQGERISTAILDGVPLYHLWFLVDLLLYIGVAALLLPRLGCLASLNHQLDRLPLWAMLPALAVFSVALTIAARLTGVAYENVFGLTSLFRLATYAPFFAVGIVMFDHKAARETFLRTPVALILIALPIALYAKAYTHDHGALVGEAALTLEYLAIWVSVAAVLRIFHALFRTDSPITRFLSDAAYSVFLFHHIIVATLGAALLAYPLGAWVKFILVAGISLSLSALIHVTLIAPNPVARRLFNGK